MRYVLEKATEEDEEGKEQENWEVLCHLPLSKAQTGVVALANAYLKGSE